MTSHSRGTGSARVVHRTCPSRSKGAGNAGCSAAPAASRANEKRTRASHHRYAETFRHSPRVGLRLISCSPRCAAGVPGLIATVACGITRKLDTSVGVSGPHDFAVRIASLASRYQRVHRILHPTSVAIARTPLGGTGRPESVPLICPDGTRRIFFARGLDTYSQTLPVRANQRLLQEAWAEAQTGSVGSHLRMASRE